MLKVFKCRACVASSAQTSSLISPVSNVVRVKLPMVPVNGKRPIVELVMMQGGKYQPIKFSNNMQVRLVYSIRQTKTVMINLTTDIAHDLFAFIGN